MADSIREKILAELVTRLSSTSGVAGRVFRSRIEAVQRNEMPAIVVMPATETPEQRTSSCRVDKRLTVNVMVLLHDDVPDRAADPIVQDAHKRILPTTTGRVDFTLGGLAIDIEEAGTDFRLAATDGVVVMTYTIWYRHAVADMAVA